MSDRIATLSMIYPDSSYPVGRSRTWSGRYREIAEAALAHVVGGVEGAYHRSDLFERRRTLMKTWQNISALDTMSGQPGPSSDYSRRRVGSQETRRESFSSNSAHPSHRMIPMACVAHNIGPVLRVIPDSGVDVMGEPVAVVGNRRRDTSDDVDTCGRPADVQQFGYLLECRQELSASHGLYGRFRGWFWTRLF